MTTGPPDEPTLRGRLESERAIVTWRDVRPHHERGAVFLLEPGASLVEAGVAVIEDDVATVDAMLSDGRLSKLAGEQAEAWNQTGAPPLECVIAQPWVLIQAVDVG